MKFKINMTETKREILGLSKITYKFQITIPKRVREVFNLKEGDTIVFLKEGNKLLIVKSTDIWPY